LFGEILKYLNRITESEMVREFMVRGFEQKLMELYEDFKVVNALGLSCRASRNKHQGSIRHLGKEWIENYKFHDYKRMEEQKYEAV